MTEREVAAVNAVYEAWSESLLQETSGIIRWIPLRAERIRVAPYRVLIRDFDALSSAEQSLAKGFADEFFGLSEWNLLAAAFTGDGVLSLRRREIGFPIECRDDAGNILRPYPRAFGSRKGKGAQDENQSCESDQSFHVILHHIFY